ncbi:MAG: di-trans,poly-cis-decaprenylcistransferase [Elusimicrobiaceae bacterium]|nr:di-trans,poly-cis-decaprenylcistransferase [Elusimicrobiaceae bacterium]
MKINSNTVPKHIAIIMDGNGRWAKAKGLPRMAGHKQGVKTAENIIKNCQELGVDYLTLFVFSCENWARPKTEVNGLMNILKGMLKKYSQEKTDIKFLFSGRESKMPIGIISGLKKLANQTKKHKGLVVNLAINYGGQQEITDAVNRVILSGKKKIKDGDLEKYLYNNTPPVDLIIRTSGEQRVSNFLIWQSAYSEFYFTKTLWPNFKKSNLEKAISEYQNRTRRYGGI